VLSGFGVDLLGRSHTGMAPTVLPVGIAEARDKSVDAAAIRVVWLPWWFLTFLQ